MACCCCSSGPIDGLGFALDYTRGLSQLGNERQLDLRARAGLHVGEVLTWRNSDEAVQRRRQAAGSRRPRQADGRAADGDGASRPDPAIGRGRAAGASRRTRTGRTRPTPAVEILGPLALQGRARSRSRSSKSANPALPRCACRRARPRHGATFRCGGVPRRSPRKSRCWWVARSACWFITRPSPLSPSTSATGSSSATCATSPGRRALDDSLEQAFRISLEQSRHVNVLSDLKARDTLARMQRAPDTVLDRAIASEIAIRDGARAVILPTVAEVGGRVRVSAEVIDPRTQTTVYAESADGVGIDSSLGSIDTVTAALRGKLGEAVKSIEQDSAPLPQVTTTQPGCAAGVRARAEGLRAAATTSDALQLYERATQLDPQFALAWIGSGARALCPGANPGGVHAAAPGAGHCAIASRRAKPCISTRGRPVSTRRPRPRKSGASWRSCIRISGRRRANAAMWLYRRQSLRGSTEFTQRGGSVPQDRVGRHRPTTRWARPSLGWGSTTPATMAFDAGSRAWLRGACAARMAVSKRCERTSPQAQNAAERKLPADDQHAYLERTSLAVDQAQWDDARDAARDADAGSVGSKKRQ